jgi:hypothetical protein
MSPPSFGRKMVHVAGNNISQGKRRSEYSWLNFSFAALLFYEIDKPTSISVPNSNLGSLYGHLLYNARYI